MLGCVANMVSDDTSSEGLKSYQKSWRALSHNWSMLLKKSSAAPA